MPNKLSATQIAQLNNSNAAMQRAQAGTKVAVLNKITQTVARSQFTDGGAASGTFVLTDGVIPAGATVLFSAIQEIVGFTGNTSAVLTIGDGTDVDRYNTGTPNVFVTAANGVSAGVPSGAQYHTADASVTLTVTSAADFTAVTAGSVTVSLYYLL
jgi:hypothetical protein